MKAGRVQGERDKSPGKHKSQASAPAAFLGNDIMSTKAIQLPGTGEVSNLAWAIIFAVALIAVLAIIAGPAFAGADTTFDLAFNKFVGFLEGSGGKIIALLALAGGLIGMAAGAIATKVSSSSASARSPCPWASALVLASAFRSSLRRSRP